MIELDYLFFKDRNSFRRWLEMNHNYSPGIWMIYHKKHTNIKNIAYHEALEEALCFGWIDSLKKRIDDEKYARKFTPRKNITKWSDINKKLVMSLLENGSMTEAGLCKIDMYLETGKVNWDIDKLTKGKDKNEFEIPEFILMEFANNEPALTNFNKLAPSHKRNYIRWITEAKRDKTVYNRLQESVKLFMENKKLGLK